ncbi:DUF4177 domain-containing protein [Xanthomonas sp. AM6]|uniref:DUF4177 domain-containing protein n=1 Tax=Xanthomonas sp. AM6 TaxID=2982531 RepID=UPI0021DA332B|nr:DUF4177 domain-containing protein [Xanthomonas sp. AM6]UYB51240.1 DUF4177 domain-containing protein [Xanthomonas sp. AM6]
MSTRWNYLTVEVKPTFLGGLNTELIQAELDRHGAQGWELVNVISAAPLLPTLLVFKKAN